MDQLQHVGNGVLAKQLKFSHAWHVKQAEFKAQIPFHHFLISMPTSEFMPISDRLTSVLRLSTGLPSMVRTFFSYFLGEHGCRLGRLHHRLSDRAKARKAGRLSLREPRPPSFTPLRLRYMAMQISLPQSARVSGDDRGIVDPSPMAKVAGSTCDWLLVTASSWPATRY